MEKVLHFTTKNTNTCIQYSMNKQNLISDLKEQSLQLAKISETIAESQVMETEGTLVTRSQHGKIRLFQRFDKTEIKYLREDDGPTVGQLSSKAYLQKLDKAATLEKRQIDRCIELLESKKTKEGFDQADIDLVYGSLPQHIKDNTNPSILTDDGFAEKWQNEPYQRRWMKKGETYYETPKGDKVRSKSEWMIACMLAEAGVPYRYEALLPVSEMFQVFCYPDFTVLNKRTRKEYYWEHAGALEDPEYVANNFIPKLSEYFNFDILPGDKLLLTFESKRRPLDTTQVKRLIDHYLI